MSAKQKFKNIALVSNTDAQSFVNGVQQIIMSEYRENCVVSYNTQIGLNGELVYSALIRVYEDEQ